jgi:hypothetical protein
MSYLSFSYIIWALFMFKPNKTTPKYFSVEHNFLLDAFIDEHLFLSFEYSAVSFFSENVFMGSRNYKLPWIRRPYIVKGAESQIKTHNFGLLFVRKLLLLLFPVFIILCWKQCLKRKNSFFINNIKRKEKSSSQRGARTRDPQCSGRKCFVILKWRLVNRLS